MRTMGGRGGILLGKRLGGQALLESLVAVPLVAAVWLGAVLLSRLHDVESRAIALARYTAFAHADSSRAAAGARLDSAATARVWAPSERGLEQNDTWDSARFARAERAAWRTPTGAADLVARADSVAARTANGALGGAPGRATDIAVGATRAVGLLGVGDFDLRNERMLTSDARVEIARAIDLPAPLDELDLVLRDRMVLLADPWSAAGPEHVVRRVEPLLPTSGLGRLMTVLSPLQALVSLIEPEFINLCIGHVDPEVLPPDRLSVRAGAPRSNWRPACRVL